MIIFTIEDALRTLNSQISMYVIYFRYGGEISIGTKYQK